MFGQNFVPGKPQSYSSDKYFSKLIGADRNGFYELRYNFKGTTDKAFYVDQYNTNTLSRIRKVEIGNYVLEDEVIRNTQFIKDFTKVISNIFLLNDKMYIFSKMFNPPEKKVQLVADIFSTVNGDFLAADSVIADVSSYRYDVYEKKFHLSLSPDSTKILCIANSSIANDQQTATAILFKADDFSKIWEKHLMNAQGNHYIKSRECRVDMADNLFYFFVASSSLDNSNLLGSGFAYLPKKENKEEVLFWETNTGIHPYNPVMDYLRGDNSFCFVSDFKEAKQANEIHAGVIAVRFSSAQKKLLSMDTIYFSPENRNKIKCSLGNDLNKYSFAPPGVKMINQNIYLYTNMDYMDGVAPVIHKSGIIFVCKLDGKGKEEWQTMIAHSAQYTFALSNNDPTRMAVNVGHDKLSFILTDHDLETQDFCNLKPVISFENTVLAEISLDEKGTVSRKTLFKNGIITFLPSEAYIHPAGNPEIFHYKKGSTEGFAKLSAN